MRFNVFAVLLGFAIFGALFLAILLRNAGG